jgi:tRNA U34 5-methylaminomethyl-2-thiouridine-forming methyltransferase MnmC
MNNIVCTKDGSFTFFSDNFEETYHSTHGARSESQHVFIYNGLNFLSNKPHVKIFEIGFGTGLNTLLTLKEAKSQKIDYHSVEKFPLKFNDHCSFKASLHYNEQISYDHLISAKWNTSTQISESFNLTKYHVCIEKFNIGTGYDIVYFDAFSPRKQPELWDPLILNKMYACLNKNGVFVTYCAKGQVKRDLVTAGFSVDTLPGPPGKREMIRAIKE